MQIPGGRQVAIVTTKKWPDNRMRLESDGTEELRMPGCVHIAAGRVPPRISSKAVGKNPGVGSDVSATSPAMPGVFGPHGPLRKTRFCTCLSAEGAQPRCSKVCQPRLHRNLKARQNVRRISPEE